MRQRAGLAAPLALLVLLAAPLVGAAACTGSSAAPLPDATPVVPVTPLADAGGDAATTPGEDAGDPFSFAGQPHSCAYTCPSSGCKESTAPYSCPSLGTWGQVPHDTPCGAWDGGYPVALPGNCTATAPSGDAIVTAQKAGTPIVLPDGRRITPAGHDWLFDETDVPQSIPTSAIAVPGTTFVLVVDQAYTSNNAVRVVDSAKIDGTTNPTVSYVTFANPLTLNRGIAFVAPGEVYVASDDGVIHALTLNTATGALALDDTAHALKLPASVNDQGNPANYYVQGLAASPDGTRLVATSVFDSKLLVFDVKPSSPTFGTQIGQLGVGAQTWGAWFDPHDATGQYVYVSSIGANTVLEVDVSTPTAPVLTATYATDKNPQGIVFFDGRWMAVANDFGDSLDLIDRTTGTVTPVPISLEGDGLHGADPSTLAYDATNTRLYVTLAGANAIEAWGVSLATTPPTLTPQGALPTAWWPSDVVVLADGSLVVPNLKGHGNGPYAVTVPPDDGDGMAGASGGIQKVPAPALADLTAGATQVNADDDVSSLAGHSTVVCDGGAPYDFPVPTTNDAGASPQITHVIFILRENKAFDGIFGDFPNVNGDPSLTAKTTTASLDKLWVNLRNVARTFALSDNYYTDAELSVQGHQWTTYARTTDYCEREWIEEGYSRSAFASPAPSVATAPYGQPAEGSIFDWLGRNKVPYNVLGEGDGIPVPVAGLADPVDVDYPGGPVQSIGFPDIEKACYFAGRERILCDLGSVVYMTLPNDHCSGVSPKTPSPETMIATNDEATGMVIDAISHSPLWASSLVIATEDDPQQGGDHVDHHRTPIVFASPWIKRGYVSHTHIDVPSVAKLVAHVYGIPYPNGIVARAGLPLDLFTSTPDYTPYTYTPRQEPLTCGVAATPNEIRDTERWDLTDVDNQPGLDDMVAKWLRSDRVKGAAKH